jgi:hypothetical protein
MRTFSIDNDNKYRSTRTLLKILHNLKVQSANAADSDVLYTHGDDFETCYNCDQVGVDNCMCNAGASMKCSDFFVGRYDDYDFV